MRLQLFLLALAAGLILSEPIRKVRDDDRSQETQDRTSARLTRSVISGQGFGNFSTRSRSDDDRITRISPIPASTPRLHTSNLLTETIDSGERPITALSNIRNGSASVSTRSRSSPSAISLPRSSLPSSTTNVSGRPTGRPRLSRPTNAPTSVPTTLRRISRTSRTKTTRRSRLRPTTVSRSSSRSSSGVPGISVLSQMMASVVNIMMNNTAMTITNSRAARTSTTSRTPASGVPQSVSSRFSERDLPVVSSSGIVSVFNTPISGPIFSSSITKPTTVIGVPVATVCPRRTSSNSQAFTLLSSPVSRLNSTTSSPLAPTVRPFANFARLIVGPDGCQTLYAPTSSSTTSACSTTVTPVGLPPVTISRCDQYVTFSSETAVTCAPTSSVIPLMRREAASQTTRSFNYAILPNEPEYGTPPPPPATIGRSASVSVATGISLRNQAADLHLVDRPPGATIPDANLKRDRIADLHQVDIMPKVRVKGANLKRDSSADLHRVDEQPEVRVVGANLAREVAFDFRPVDTAIEVKIAGANLKRDTAADLHVVNVRPPVHIPGANLKREALPEPDMGEVKPGIFVAPSVSALPITTVTVANTVAAGASPSMLTMYLNITEQISRIPDSPSQFSNKLANIAQFSPPQPMIYYAAPFAEVARGGVPTNVREIKCSGGVIPEPTDVARCQTTTEMWSFSSFNRTSYVARTISFSGPVVFSTDEFTTTTTIRFSSVTTSTKLVPTGIVVRSTLRSDGPTITIPVTKPAVTSTIVLDRLSASSASSTAADEATTTIITSTIVQTVTVAGPTATATGAAAAEFSNEAPTSNISPPAQPVPPTPSPSALDSGSSTPAGGIAGLNEPGATSGGAPILP